MVESPYENTFVEDSAAMQRLYTRALKAAGFEVVLVNDGIKAHDAALTEQPDLILMDMMLPEMNGLDALMVPKDDEHTETIPVIMVSAHDDELLIEVMKSGANRYIIRSNIEVTDVASLIHETIAAHPKAT